MVGLIALVSDVVLRSMRFGSFGRSRRSSSSDSKGGGGAAIIVFIIMLLCS